MTIYGITIRRPSFIAFIRSGLLALALWGFLYWMRGFENIESAIGFYIFIFYGTISAEMGIELSKGWKHIALYSAGGFGILFSYFALVNLLVH